MKLVLTQIIYNKTKPVRETTPILKINYKIKIIFIRLLELCLARL
jgi:hypothetical protein